MVSESLDEEQPASGDVALSGVPEGSRARIVRVEGGLGLTSRLTSMGLLRGEIVTVLRGGERGPCVVQVKGARIMVGRGMANRIFVRPV